MEFVQPIRDKRKIESMKRVLRGSSLRDCCLFVLGINSGLRISDLLELTVADVMEGGKVKERIVLREEKTDKLRNFPIADNASKAISEYLATRQPQPEEPLFLSRKKGGKLKRVRAWAILNEAAEAVGITDNIGTHTLRKTFGYHTYQATKNVVLLQEIFNHSHPSITLCYIGVTQDEQDAAYKLINL